MPHDENTYYTLASMASMVADVGSRLKAAGHETVPQNVWHDVMCKGGPAGGRGVDCASNVARIIVLPLDELTEVYVARCSICNRMGAMPIQAEPAP